jgi:CMP-N-acetylneuraminic acid synthetase
MRRIAYIPARGGSKGIPKKNIAQIGDVPLIAFTILAALKSGLFDKVMVSTDSEEIADVARQYGAWVPFLRYAEFAQDTSKTIDAVVSDKTRLEEMGEVFDTFVLLQCTSPFRTAKDIQGAVELSEKAGGGVVSISAVDEHPILMRTIGEDGKLTRVLNCSSTCRRQDMPPYYRVNGAIYVNAWDELASDLSLNDNPYGYVMEQKDALDIDTLADLENARKRQLAE